MASDNTYSAEFKAKVAREALDQSKENVQELAQKYDVPVSAVLAWASKLENKGPEAFKEEVEEESEAAQQASTEDQESVGVEVTNPDIAESIEYGVMRDRLNYRRLVFWSVLGTVIFLIFVQALIEMFQYNSQISRQRVLEGSEYYNITDMKKSAEETLNSFGVVDLENNIYRIPLDSAINEIAGESE